MTENNQKLVAKIQHFYDFMQTHLDKQQDKLIELPTNVMAVGAEDILTEVMMPQYRELFNDFLYPETPL